MIISIQGTNYAKSLALSTLIKQINKKLWEKPTLDSLSLKQNLSNLNHWATTIFNQKRPPLLKNHALMHYKASPLPTKVPENVNMAASAAPVAIGTRGTVGSLLRKEIEYFTKFETDRCASYMKPPVQKPCSSTSSGHSRPSFWSLTLLWRRKKRRCSGTGFLPRMCSAVEVTDSEQFNEIRGFSYRILKNDMTNFDG